MGRPKKQTVDYFPHVCRHGKTMFILEQKYGNDGYAFWFKLLELLGDTEGHFIDCNDLGAWAFLSAKTLLPEEKCNEILSFLVSLGAIDQELWSKRIIWSQKFIDNLEDLYARRKVDLPTKESLGVSASDAIDEIYRQKSWCRNATNRAIQKGQLLPEPCVVCKTTENIEAHHPDYSNPFQVVWLCRQHHNCLHNDHINGINVDINPADQCVSGITVDINPQSKVKESKVKESKALDAMPVFSCTYFEVDQKYLDKLLLTYSALSQERLVKEFDRMNDWLEDNKDKRSRKSNGQIKNPRLFIRNWLDRVIIQPDKKTPSEPKGFAGIREWYHGKENEPGS